MKHTSIVKRLPCLESRTPFSTICKTEQIGPILTTFAFFSTWLASTFRMKMFLTILRTSGEQRVCLSLLGKPWGVLLRHACKRHHWFFPSSIDVNVLLVTRDTGFSIFITCVVSPALKKTKGIPRKPLLSSPVST